MSAPQSIMVSIPPNPSRSVKYVPRQTQLAQTVSQPSSALIQPTVRLPAPNVLRPETQYIHPVEYRRRNQALYKAFQKCYQQYITNKTLDVASKKDLETIHVSSEEFDQLVVKKELGGKIELIRGTIVFNVWTLFPHGAAITWLSRHVDNQDTNELFDSGTGVHYPLAPGDTKQPDVHWSLARIHIPQNLMANFATDPTHGNILPGFCMEVAVKNESIPTLVDTDVPRYFAPTAATRCWVGINIFIDESGKRNHSWNAAQVDRDWDPNTNTFLNTTTESPASFPRIVGNNQLLTVPIPGRRFQIDVQRLIHPLPLPPNQPAYFYVDLEAFRIKVLQWLS